MKAICLLSGGLDSQLAIRLVLKQGIDVIAVHFRTIFCNCPSTVSRGRSNRTPKDCGRSTASRAAEELGIPIVEINNTIDFLKVVKNPSHGYGRGMNPCIDCRILMFKKAKKYMEEAGADFIVTGEVLGQRPMSQRRDAMKLIEKETDLTGLILRPLSARLLSPTIPEEKGWIDRGKLIAHSGRSRKEQIRLAEVFNMKDYPCASGGCLLTDKDFSKRIKESFQYGEDDLNDMQLLKIGRHFRLLNKIKLIIGRNEVENKRLINLACTGDILIEPVNVPGPSTLLRTGLLKKDLNGNVDDYLELAAYVCARYSDGNGNLVLRYGVKNGIDVIWEKELCAKIPFKSSSCAQGLGKSIISDDYCRRI